MKVSTTKIRVPADYPTQLSRHLTQVAYKALKHDIVVNGLRDPVEVAGPDLRTGMYRLVHGRLRLRAIMELGLDEVPVTVTPLPEGESVEGFTLRSNGRLNAPNPRRGKGAIGPTVKAKARDERRKRVLPLFKEGLPTVEIAAREGCSPSSINDDRNFFIETGQLDPPPSKKLTSRPSVGMTQTTNVLNRVATMLVGITSSLNDLRPEDVAALTEFPWEAEYRDAARAISRVRRSFK